MDSIYHYLPIYKSSRLTLNALYVSVQSPCCGKVYPCRLCHNEKDLTHEIDRHAVSEIVCRKCDTKQPVSTEQSD